MFVSRQDMHLREKRTNLAAKQASKQKEEGRHNFIPVINTKSREMAGKKAESLISQNRFLRPTASSEHKRCASRTPDPPPASR